MKINGRVIKWRTPFWFYSMCWLTMSFAGHEIVSSKFQGIPRSFASRPNIDFSVNFRAVDFIRRHTSRLKGFIYKLIKELNFGVVRLKATGYVYDKSRFINALYSHKAHEVFSINIEWVEWTKLTWWGDSARLRESRASQVTRYFPSLIMFSLKLSGRLFGGYFNLMWKYMNLMVPYSQFRNKISVDGGQVYRCSSLPTEVTIQLRAGHSQFGQFWIFFRALFSPLKIRPWKKMLLRRSLSMLFLKPQSTYI